MELILTVVSIPILVLRQSHLRLGQKLAMSSFLSLSLAMVVMAIMRVSNLPGVASINSHVFWGHMEACVAILMASLTSYRSIFVLRQERKRQEKRMKLAPRSRSRWGFRTGLNDEDLSLPTVPRATLTGIRTMVWRNNRTMDGRAVVHTEGEAMETLELYSPNTVQSVNQMV